MKYAVGLVYNNKETNNNKYYIMWIEGNNVTVNWGRIDSNWQKKIFRHSTYEEAVKFINTKMKEKMKKGYWKWPIEKITASNSKEYI